MTWVTKGGGEVASDQNRNNVHFIVASHGVLSCPTPTCGTYITTHWIRSCLEVQILTLPF